MSSKSPDIIAMHEWPPVANAVFDACSHSLLSLNNNKNAALLVAYSGGLDSTLLLLAAHRFCQVHGNTLRAIYIDHGLQHESKEWANHCFRQCDARGIAFQAISVNVARGGGASPEQAARDARNSALEQQINADEWMLTAHHADDQAETVLLQLLRGAGVRGLAAMPEQKRFAKGWHVRPLLSVSRQQLQQAADSLQLQWIEDTSNADTRFDRNYIRHKIIPELQARWPSVSRSLSRSASHCTTASSLLQQLAASDTALSSTVMSIEVLDSLAPARRLNVLRAWIEQHGFSPPSTVKLQHIERDLVLASSDSSGQVQFGNQQIRRHRRNLYLGLQTDFLEARPFCYQWVDRAEPVHIIETGQIISAVDIDLPWLPADEPLVLQSRKGGEKLRMQGNVHTHSVKSLLQQQGLPPWLRGRVPFVWRNDRLVGVLGIGFAGPAD